MADVTVVSVAAALVFGLLPSLRWALSEPKSSPREIAAYVVVVLGGVGYLLVQGMNALDPTGVGVLAYLGAGGVGTLLVDGAKAAGAALPQTSPSP